MMGYIRKAYGVLARRGLRVIAIGKPGVITGSRGAYLRIKLDGERRSRKYHPIWEIDYLLVTSTQAAIDRGPTNI